MARNPLTIIRGYISYYEESIKHHERERNSDERIAQLNDKLSLLQTIEADMEIEYFELGDETTIGDLRPGAVFATGSGTYAVKSEYKYSDEASAQYQCILLESGEYAHFKDGNATGVWEVIQPRKREGEADPDVTRSLS